MRGDDTYPSRLLFDIAAAQNDSYRPCRVCMEAARIIRPNKTVNLHNASEGLNQLLISKAGRPSNDPRHSVQLMRSTRLMSSPYRLGERRVQSEGSKIMGA